MSYFLWKVPVILFILVFPLSLVGSEAGLVDDFMGVLQLLTVRGEVWR